MTFIDLKQLANETRQRINAETELATARQALIESYAKVTVEDILDSYGFSDTSDEVIQTFIPLMEQALAMNLPVHEIDRLLLEAIQEVVSDVEESND